MSCLLPARDLPDVGVSDVFEHAFAYVVLMLWCAGLTARSRHVAVALALSALGVALELLQGAMGLGRTADPLDVAANTLGVALGFALARAGLADWMHWIESLLPGS